MKRFHCVCLQNCCDNYHYHHNHRYNDHLVFAKFVNLTKAMQLDEQQQLKCVFYFSFVFFFGFFFGLLLCDTKKVFP